MVVIDKLETAGKLQTETIMGKPKFSTKKAIVLSISMVVLFVVSVFPVQAFTLSSKHSSPASSQGESILFPDVFFPGLEWNEIKGFASIDFITDGDSASTRSQGITYRSGNFEGKPSAELFAFYYLNHMKALGWQYVAFLSNSFLMEIQYYNPKVDRGLDVKIGRCRFLDSSIEQNSQFCAEVWISSSPIVPAPKTRALSETEIPYHPITATPDNPSAFQNPLPVPFYSQRASDPTGSITQGYGNCAFTLYDLGCTVAVYAMIYSYYQPDFTNPIRLNESLKVAPGVFSLYQSGCYIYWPDYLDLPDAPVDVFGSVRVYNACASPNCLDESNITLIDTELKLGHPIHARVHWEGEDENHHSVVIIGHVGNVFYILDPLALDSSSRTLSSGVEGEYIVDYLIPTHGKPPAKGSSSISGSFGTNETRFYIKKYFPNPNIFLK